MNNIRIESQKRACYIGKKKYEYFNVIADSIRFGNNEIMFQGTFQECINYVKRNGKDYTQECFVRNRKTDIQVSFRMYSIIEINGSVYTLKTRDGFIKQLDISKLIPIAENTFVLSPGLHGEKQVTLKLMNARSW